jgi:tRNA A37 threonylcarbamoyladenosine modification protein TsaB
VSVAKALAHALRVPLAGVGRLELDAWRVMTEARDRRVVAIHRAGRGEVAWAAYSGGGAAWIEASPPRITQPALLYDALRAGDAVVGDIDDDAAAAIARAGATVVSPRAHRVVALAAAGHSRLSAGRADDPTALVPLYLRAPAIGPTDRTPAT